MNAYVDEYGDGDGSIVERIVDAVAVYISYICGCCNAIVP